MRARNNEEQQELSEDHQNETDEKIGVYRKYFEPAETVSILHSESSIVSLGYGSNHGRALGELIQMKKPQKNLIPCYTCY